MEYKDKNILISGGSSGIGLALAKEFASLGANITILARRKNKLESALKEIKNNAVSPDQKFKSLSADVSNYEELKKILSEDTTPYDVLINSAGIAYPGKFVDLEPEIFKRIMDVNYLGTVYFN